MDEQQNTSLNSYLTFKLGDEFFAAHVGNVLNILEMVKITEVPKSPDYMKGVINLRGNVLPVVDTRVKFGMSPTKFTKHTCILVLSVEIEGESVDVGGLVDSVQEVIEVENEQIQASPSIGSKYRSEFIKGMLKHDEQFIMLLDMNKVFSTDDVILLKESTETAISDEDTPPNAENQT